MLFGNCYHGNSCYDNTHVVAKVIVAVVTYNVCDVAFYMDSMSPRTSCVQYGGGHLLGELWYNFSTYGLGYSHYTCFINSTPVESLFPKLSMHQVVEEPIGRYKLRE